MTEPSGRLLVAADMNEVINEVWAVRTELVARRTALQSPLIPMEYLTLQSLEVWARWPEIVAAVTEAGSPEDLAAAFRRPGTGVNATHFFCLVNLPMGGRQTWARAGVRWSDERWRLSVVIDFWRRATAAWRGDGHLTARDADGCIRPYSSDVVDQVAAAAVGLTADRDRALVHRSMATLLQYLFLVFMECRVGIGDSGPYALPDGRQLVVRELSGLSRCWVPWSGGAASVPWNDLVCGLVLRRGVHAEVNDTATVFTDPADTLAVTDAVALLRVDGNDLRPLTLDEFEGLASAVSAVSIALYRDVARWTREERMAAGALVYFTIVRPWTVAGGIVDDVDWAMPRDGAEALVRILGGGTAGEATAYTGSGWQPVAPDGR